MTDTCLMALVRVGYCGGYGAAAAVDKLVVVARRGIDGGERGGGEMVALKK